MADEIKNNVPEEEEAEVEAEETEAVVEIEEATIEG